jgi:hypothetical protein
MNKYNEILLKEAVDKYFDIKVTTEERKRIQIPINLYKLVKLFEDNKNLYDIDVRNAILHMPAERQEGEDFNFYKKRLKLRGVFVRRRNLFFEIKTEE